MGLERGGVGPYITMQWDQPVNRLTVVTENITFLQTTYPGGKNMSTRQMCDNLKYEDSYCIKSSPHTSLNWLLGDPHQFASSAQALSLC